MSEIKAADFAETKTPKVENFKNIQPESMGVNEAKDFWDEKFKPADVQNIDEWAEEDKSYKAKLDRTPIKGERGEWEGKRGESKFIPSNETPDGEKCKSILKEMGLDGIEYKNAEPDFSKVAIETVKIDDMTSNRENYFDEADNKHYGNFSQADLKVAEEWNKYEKDGKSDWTGRDVKNFRKENELSWHERCDTKTMDLVPTSIHKYCTHSGGVAECKMRDGIDGGVFDE